MAFSSENLRQASMGADMLMQAFGIVSSNSVHTSRTPERIGKMYAELLRGYKPRDFAFTTFPSTATDLVICHDIPVYSLCAHHMIPFFGKAQVGYIPRSAEKGGRVVGLSKIPRLVQYLAAKLQVQEELTREVAEAMEQELNPLGVAVTMTCRHLCVEMRGAKTPAITTTSAMRGVFLTEANHPAKVEFLSLCSKGR